MQNPWLRKCGDPTGGFSRWRSKGRLFHHGDRNSRCRLKGKSFRVNGPVTVIGFFRIMSVHGKKMTCKFKL